MTDPQNPTPMLLPLSEGPPPPQYRYAALVSYVGTRYCGWQAQLGPDSGKLTSIQETIQDRLVKMTSEEDARVIGSGRTDSGVHAVGQVIHFRLKRKEWNVEVLRNGFNSLLPGDIRVLQVKRCPDRFHAQRSAIRKQYSYYFQQGPAQLPHMDPFTWWIRKPLDLPAMQRALDHLVGEQDFKAFQSSGASVTTTVRTIFEAKLEPVRIPFPEVPVYRPDRASAMGLVRMRLVGSGFLKQMVRSIAGTLLPVGEGRASPDSFREILDGLDRRKAGLTAPGRGLWLERVWYADFEFDEDFNSPFGP